MPDTLDKLVRKRGAVKARLTSLRNFFDSLKSSLQPDVLKLRELDTRLAKCENLLEQFGELQAEIEGIDPHADPSELQTFENIYFSTHAEVKEFLSIHSKPNKSQSSSNQILQTGGVKLPTIELPKFSGAYERWLEFKELFTSLIHNCNQIEPVQKFYYLKASLEGPAAQCIKALELTSQNYIVAWEILCQRFDNKSLIVHNHVKALFNMPETKPDFASSFRDLIDNISKNIRSLEILNVETSSWDPLIIYLGTMKLDSDTLREWEQLSFQGALPTLQEFKTFLSDRAEFIEKINMHKPKVKPRDFHHTKPAQRSFVSSSRLPFTTQPRSYSCFHCKQPHSIFTCREFLALPLSQKVERVAALNLCSNCFQRGHQVSGCKAGHCKHCNLKHNSLLHPFERASASVGLTPTRNPDPSNSTPNQLQTSGAYCNYAMNNQVLLATALVHVFDSQGGVYECKALLDTGSMSNFITQRLLSRLCLPVQRANFSVIGIGHAQTSLESSCEIVIRSRHSTFQSSLQCLVIPSIADNIPGTWFDPSSLEIPNHVQLADPTFFEPGQIDLLIGADTFWSLLGKSSIRLGPRKPIIQETKLGWVLSGRLEVCSRSVSLCHFSQNVDLQKQLCKFWELEEMSSGSTKSEEEALAESHFTNTCKQNSQGRFVVSVPLKQPISKLGQSRDIAVKQFFRLEKKLLANPQLHQMYSDFMAEYLELSHMSPFTPSADQITFYSPHHGVIREDSSTTKLRVVFNSSSASSSGVSYNDIQMVGPTVQEDLLSILLRFRQHAFVFTADICKMYRQVLVKDEFKPLQLILWRATPEENLQTFSLNTVTYGTASAPFLATRCVKQLAIQHEKSHPIASRIIRRDFYVDDLLSGANSVNEAVDSCNQVSTILNSGCFELRKWRSNSAEVLDGIRALAKSTDDLHFASVEASKTLGLFWSSTEDTFSFHISLPPSKRVTKRLILSQTARIFDPLGLAGPVIITAKILLQSLWLLKLNWDQEVPATICNRWKSFKLHLLELNSLKIRRHVSVKDCSSIELHGFSDASQQAYGACIYVRTVDASNQVHVHLLASKTRVAPLKVVSIPRLELCAALLLAQLFQRVTNSLTFQFSRHYMWCDSTVALAWIRTPPHLLQSFVGNRVSKIQELAKNCVWRYVPSEFNPADILSRGMAPKLFVKSNMWFSGPSFLNQSSSEWPMTIPSSTGELPEMKKIIQTFVNAVDPPQFPFERFSSFSRLKRVCAYCFRFYHNAKRPPNERTYGNLTIIELRTATNLLVSVSQKQSFTNDINDLLNSGVVSRKSKLLSLTPFLENGIIKVGGRLNHSSFPYSKKHPAVLASNHRLTYLIFKHKHLELLHGGPQLLLAAIREEYWPISGKNLAKKVVRECVICFRYKPTIPNPLMGQLPKHRVSPMPLFSNTGVDYAGPFMIRDRKGRGCKKQKCWLALFICLATRSIHLELVTDLSTQSFLETFQRFIARKGKPSDVYSDNGTTFVGANNHLKDLGRFLMSNQEDISMHIHSVSNVNWHFIAAYSPHHGGLWEAGVKSAKHHIKRVVANASLTFEKFYTVITQIEAILNSRPLTALSTDPNDLQALTPAHFLIGRSLQTIPHPELTNVPSNRLNHFEQLEVLKQHFWTRWMKEYIPQLQQRTKWKLHQNNISVGTMVLVRDDSAPPFLWPLGRVVAVHPGADNVVRIVSVKTIKGVIKRSVTKVCPLPVSTESS